MSNSQLQDIITRLNVDGYVTRNWALRNYIGRLASRIDDLKKLGWEFRPETVKENGGKNFYYYVVHSPLKKVVYTIPGMEDVEGNLKKLTLFK